MTEIKVVITDFSIEPIQLTGEDPEIDFMAAEEQIESEFHYDHILESIAPLFESITKGAKHLSEKLHEDENPEMSELLTRGFE